jgi:hypothetical protein
MASSRLWDGEAWSHLCRTSYGEGGQEVFAFPPVSARYVRWKSDNPEPTRALKIIEINLYSPADVASVREPGRISALGHAPIELPPGESIRVDFGYVRFPLGATSHRTRDRARPTYSCERGRATDSRGFPSADTPQIASTTAPAIIKPEPRR